MPKNNKIFASVVGMNDVLPNELIKTMFDLLKLNCFKLQH